MNSYDPEELALSQEQLVELMARKRDSRQPSRSRKAGFLQFSTVFLLRLRLEKAPCIVWAMVWALSEAWFTAGLHGQHPNPFPLARVDTQKWRLDRWQKRRALQFLVKRRLVELDRTDPQNPKVSLAWVQPGPS